MWSIDEICLWKDQSMQLDAEERRCNHQQEKKKQSQARISHDMEWERRYEG